MTNRPRVLLAAQSPAPTLITGPIVLYHHTWYGHIEPDHDVQLQAINRAIANPCYIASSLTEPGDFVFVNSVDLNEWNEELRVPVRTIAPNTNIVTTAYHTDSTYHGPILWTPSND